MGFKLKWAKNKGRRYIRLVDKDDIRDKTIWNEAIKWHLENAVKFKGVFNPKITEFYENNTLI